MESLKETFDRCIMPTYGRYGLEFERGSGTRLWDTAGNEYLDFGAGIAVCTFGHAHPAVTQAVCEQAARLVHTSNLYRTIPQARLAEKLVAMAGAGKVFFCNSGAEANEGLYKLARKFGSGSEGRFKIVTFEKSFHGRTLAGIAATGQDKVKKGFEPMVEGFSYARFNDMDSVRAAVDEKTVAILLEPIQGEGGLHPATPEFLRELRAFCDERDLLLMFDEIQCGLGRTGEFLAHRAIASDVRADAVSWAKGLANGLPLGAFWASAERRLADGTPLCDALGAGSHGTTFGGNPVCCAAANAVFDTIEKEHLLDNVKKMGKLLAETLRKVGCEVRGMGLMLGLQLPEGKTSADFVKALHERGLLAIVAGESVVRFLPPLNVTEAEITEAVKIVLEVYGA